MAPTGFLPRLLRFSAFRSPLLSALLPPITTVFALQAVVALPSIAAQSERFYDFSGAVTFLAAGALSLYLPALRTRALLVAERGVTIGKTPLPSLLSPFTGAGAGAGAGGAGWNWRQVLMTGMVAFWASRLGLYLFQRVLKEGKDSRFDKIKISAPRFSGAFFGQCLWVSLCLMPVLLLNGVPSVAFAALPSSVAVTDVLGAGLWVGGLSYEMVADWQKGKWLDGKRNKDHDEEFMTGGLFSKSRYPNYFGEITLWTGIATMAAGVLARKPIQLALGLSGGVLGVLATTGLSFVSPLFAALLLTKVSGVPLSETKYDKKFGDRTDYREWRDKTPMLIPKLW